MRIALGFAAALIATVVLAGSALARAPIPAQTAALKGIDKAAAKHRIDPVSAAKYRVIVNRSAAIIRWLPRARSAAVSVALKQAAAMAGKLTAPRARAVFAQLARNNSYFASKGPPANQTDTTDADGVVYRYFSGNCFEFHPLASFGALNAKVAGGKVAAADRLVRALIRMGVPQTKGGTGWEYYFNYSGGRAPWLSGMAQAVAAQALSAAAVKGAGGTKSMVAARAAYRVIPKRLVQQVGPGPWIRLYSFNRLSVLNAQLQSVISLRDYAGRAADASAAALAAAMESSAAANLERFDTGYWTYYALPSAPSPLNYQRYVVQLLKKLAPDDTRFAAAAARFPIYEKQQPAFKLADSSAGTVSFWLSKPASVVMRSSAGATKKLSLNGGWYNVAWKLPGSAGAYPVSVSARDWAGNSASFTPLPIVRVIAPAAWTVMGSAMSQSKAIKDAAEVGVVSKAVVSTTVSLGQPSFTVGAGLEDASQGYLVGGQGLGSVRLSVNWPAGTTSPDPAVITAVQSLPTDQRVIVELVANPLPLDDAGRSALAAYAGSLVQQLPAIRDLLLGPAPSTYTASDYIAALASIHDAAKANAPAVAVAAELDGAASPKLTLAALGTEYTLLSRSTSLIDELAFRPAPAAATGAWTLDNYPQLTAALGSAFADGIQPGDTLPILVDGVAVETNIPPEKAGAYPTPPGPIAGVDESVQSAAYEQALQTAVCLPNVSGLVLRHLVDKAGTADQPGDQSGLYYADGSAKTSASPFSSSTLLARRGVLRVCPGLGVPVAASTLVFPTQLSAYSPPQVELACTRDCLFLVTLEQTSDGKPLLAQRGALNGGTTSTVVQLLAGSALPVGGSYRLRARLVAQFNPGPIQEYTSPTLVAG